MKSNPKQKFINSKLGFTLIELLVVVAIIGLLVSLVSISFSRSHMKARDARRLSDVSQVRAGLELYFTQGMGYPDVAEWVAGTQMACNNTPIMTVPKDPSPLYAYSYATLGNSGNSCGGKVWSNFQFQFETEGETALGASGKYCVKPQLGITMGACL